MRQGATLAIDVPRWAVPLLRPARYKGAKGGRMRGASHFFAQLAIEEMLTDPDLRFVCIREVQRALRYSAKSLIEDYIRKMGVSDQFDSVKGEIRNLGGDGVCIFEGMQDHTADSIKSLEGFGRAWIEEAHSISDRSWRLLRPTIIRVPGAEIWAAWNPEDPDDPVDKFFNERESDDIVELVHATWRDNPFLAPEIRAEILADYEADPELSEHVWDGGYFLGGAGRVYSSYKGKPWPDGNIDETIIDPGGTLLVGMDFNVNPMSAVTAVRAADECLMLESIQIPNANTHQMCVEIRERYPDRHVVVCPDPSGSQRKTSAEVGVTDFTIIRRHGFEIRAPNAAPPVKDRENNANEMYYDPKTKRRRCRIRPGPETEELRTGLANLTYKEGTSQRDKKSRHDHICDAADYLLWSEFNVLNPNTVSIGTYRV